MLDYGSFPEQRQALICELLQKHGRVQSVPLALQLQVSEHTIRRDLQELAARGLCKKVYGGAVSLAGAPADLTARASQISEEQRRLAEAGAALLKAGSLVFLDAGSTHLALAQAIQPELALTIVTHSPAVALALLQKPQLEVILLGGRLQAQSGACLCSAALGQLTGMHFDQSFIGVCALDPQSGISAGNYDDALFKRAAIAQSDRAIVLVGAAKVPTLAPFAVAPLKDISQILLSRDLGADKQALFADCPAPVTLV